MTGKWHVLKQVEPTQAGGIEVKIPTDFHQEICWKQTIEQKREEIKIAVETDKFKGWVN
jgi:hypothetical protein